MSERTYTIEPRDLLFLRDARPMEASDAGLGANWPRPDQLWSALLHAFHRTWPERQPWEGAKHDKRPNERKESSDRFGALKSFGPFPFSGKDLYLPYPLDADMQLVPCSGTDLPKPLTHAFRALSLGKPSVRAWVAVADFQRYLLGKPLKEVAPVLFDEERTIGIALDPVTHATVESKLYQAEYLRLRTGVRMVFSASCDILPKYGNGLVDVFEKLGLSADLIIGGQQGVARLRHEESEILNLKSELSDSLLLRWTLLSPALYKAGWRPDWVDPDNGRVMLPKTPVERAAGETRDAWRLRVSQAPKFEARLIAARVGKPLVFSGWDLQTGPKPTRLAVPAGSTYVFKCSDTAEAQALAAALSWPNRRSTLFGEKGFGIGVCSSLKSQI